MTLGGYITRHTKTTLTKHTNVNATLIQMFSLLNENELIANMIRLSVP